MDENVFNSTRCYDKEKILLQEDQSAVGMKVNDSTFCNGNSRHTNIVYFFVNYRVNKNEMNFHCYPTHLMLVDFLQNCYKAVYMKSSVRLLWGISSLMHFQDSSFPLRARVENRRTRQLVSENLATFDRQETDDGGTRSQINRQRTYTDSTETQKKISKDLRWPIFRRKTKKGNEIIQKKSHGK